MRKTILAFITLALIGTGVAYLFRDAIVMAIARRAATARLGADPLASLPDGLHVGLCGAGSPFTDDTRSGPCTLVIAGKHLLVFDAGSGSARVIAKMGFNAGRIEGIFLTHFHSDHIDGLGELMLQRWVTTANSSPVPVYGPTGVEAVIAGWRQAYSLDQKYRVAHHGAATVPPDGFGGTPKTFVPDADGTAIVFKGEKDGDLQITAFLVDHKPIEPAVGYRISYKGRTVVLSGDTRKSPSVQLAATNADLLVHEALSVPLVNVLKQSAQATNRNNLVKIFDDILNYHTTPLQAAETARDAKVGYLVLNHIVPVLPPLPGMEKVFLGNASDVYTGPIRIGRDGDFFSLPAGNQKIEFSRLF